eukprot:3149005-Rhodomonas_salina.2
MSGLISRGLYAGLMCRPYVSAIAGERDGGGEGDGGAPAQGQRGCLLRAPGTLSAIVPLQLHVITFFFARYCAPLHLFTASEDVSSELQARLSRCLPLVCPSSCALLRPVLHVTHKA